MLTACKLLSETIPQFRLFQWFLISLRTTSSNLSRAHRALYEFISSCPSSLMFFWAPCMSHVLQHCFHTSVSSYILCPLPLSSSPWVFNVPFPALSRQHYVLTFLHFQISHTWSYFSIYQIFICLPVSPLDSEFFKVWDEIFSSLKSQCLEHSVQC